MHTNPVAHADTTGRAAIENKPSLALRKLGQYFTPQNEAEVLAGMAVPVPASGDTLYLLDAACGSAILACALALRLTVLYPNHKLHITCIDSDPEMETAAGRALDHLTGYLAESGTICTYELITADFYDYAVNQANNTTRFHYVISNPPFFKIAGQVAGQQMMPKLGIGNTYQLFLWLSATLLVTNGQLLFFIPRSFCSGGKFSGFRNDLVKQLKIQAIRFYPATAVLFSGDDCYAHEQVMISLIRENVSEARYVIPYSAVDAAGKDALKNEYLEYTAGDTCIPLPGTKEEMTLLRQGIAFSLPWQGIAVHIGEGGLLRSACKGFLVTQAVPGKTIRAVWYRGEGSEGLVLAAPDGKYPCYLQREAENTVPVIPAEILVLLRRYSTGESGKRLLAAVYEPTEADGGFLALDKKLLYVRKTTGVFTREEANVVAAFINSNLLHTYLYIFYGTINMQPGEIEQVLNNLLAGKKHPIATQW